MIERTGERFGLEPERLVADTAYGAAMLSPVAMTPATKPIMIVLRNLSSFESRQSGGFGFFGN